MIPFFRRIRKNLADKNQFLKYARYAIGEIVLVVIGILIALQINTWNEQRKQRSLEQDYYCRLLEDVRLDDQQVMDLLEESEERLRAANQAVRLLQDENPEKIAVATEINKAIKSIYADFKFNDAAFSDLKSGANLNIIRDKSVIRALNTYFNKVEGYVSVIEVNGENAVRVFYSHNDYFANGWAEASLKSGWVSDGIESDVKKSLVVNEDKAFSGDMKYRLLNESLLYISHNQRQIMLFQQIKEEIKTLTSILESKCK
jgi:hypothetical protein